MNPSLDGLRVTVVATEMPGERMAGPAIRALNLARCVAARGAEVTLACPSEPDADLGVPAVSFGQHSAGRFRELARGTDVVITQPLRVDVARGLHEADAAVLYDLYVPNFVEYPAAHGGEERTAGMTRALLRRNQLEYATALACGDAFICASERQRDHWLGALGQAGRLRAATAEQGSPLRPMIAVVPFGVPDEDPVRPVQPVLRGELVPEDSFVLLWSGGLWNWFDPETLLRGLRGAVDKDPAIRLVIMGAGHADPAWRDHAAGSSTLTLADDLGLTQSGHVVVADRWVPFDERVGFLLESDLGVCAYFDGDETRLSFRTRFLDHLWAGLPTLSTAGGTLTDEMVHSGAAVAVPAHDVAAWTESLVGLAADRGGLDAMGAAAHRLGDRYRWSASTQPLVELLSALMREPREGQRPSLGAVASYLGVTARTRWGRLRGQ